MEKTRMALGLDVSKLTVDVCLLKPSGEKSTTKIANNQDGFRKMLAWLHGVDLSALHASLEPTGKYSHALAYFLHSTGIRVSQVHSFAVKSHGRSLKFRSKNDRIDAYLLADYCLKNNPACWEPSTQAQQELRDLQHRLSCVEEQIQQEENRLEAGSVSQVVVEDIKESLGRLIVRRDSLSQALKALVMTDERLSENYAFIESIVGIGEKSAIMLLSRVEFEKFEDGRQVACFAGITPSEHSSGTSIYGRQAISKAGSSELRAALFYPAMSAIQHNPQMRAFAERLLAAGKPKMVIICAVMRKLLVLAAALVRKQEFYDPAYQAR